MKLRPCIRATKQFGRSTSPGLPDPAWQGPCEVPSTSRQTSDPQTQGVGREFVGSCRASVQHPSRSLCRAARVNAKDVARKLGMSQRTLARHLASEGLTFVGMLKELRMDLAKRDLADRDLSIGQIAWLLGYKDVTSFTHAFKRWTGDTPSAARQAMLNGV